MATNTKSKGTGADDAVKLIAATTKHLSGTSQVVLGGSSYTPAQITTNTADSQKPPVASPTSPSAPANSTGATATQPTSH